MSSKAEAKLTSSVDNTLMIYKFLDYLLGLTLERQVEFNILIGFRDNPNT